MLALEIILVLQFCIWKRLAISKITCKKQDKCWLRNNFGVTILHLEEACN